MDNLLNILEIVSIFNAVILALFFFRAQSQNRPANFLLALFLISLALEIIFSSEGVHLAIPLGFPPTNLITIVLLFFYAKKTVNEKISTAYYALFLPALVHITYYYLSKHVTPIFQLVEYALNLFLLISVLRIQKRHVKNLKEFYSNLEHKSLRWIKTIAIAFISFYVFWIIEDVIIYFDFEVASLFAPTSMILTFFVIIWIAYVSFEHNEIFRISLFEPVSKQDSEKLIVSQGPIEIDKEANEREQADNNQYHQKLLELKQRIIKNRFYANPKLTLRELADQLNINEKQLSATINQGAQMNFYQFINTLRIEEFKSLINSQKSEEYSNMGLANEVGFSSKSTFYAAFKNLVGMTPTEFRLKNSPNGSSRTSSEA